MSQFMEGSLTVDLASIADQAEFSDTMVVTGAVLGDFVQISCSIDLADLNVSAYVSAADTVTFSLVNVTAGAVDLGAATFYGRVEKRAAL